MRVTFDGFQSRDSVQILRKQRVEAGLTSVDRSDEPYMSLKNALYERRIAMYSYDPFIEEMLDLQRDLQRRKVDHPAKSSKGGKGRKDVSDAVCGSFWNTIRDDRVRANLPPVMDVDEFRVASGRVVDPKGADIEKPPKVQRIGGMTVDWEKLRANIKDK
jgi:hypothetical protein